MIFTSIFVKLSAAFLKFFFCYSSDSIFLISFGSTMLNNKGVILCFTDFNWFLYNVCSFWLTLLNLDTVIRPWPLWRPIMGIWLVSCSFFKLMNLTVTKGQLRIKEINSIIGTPLCDIFSYVFLWSRNIFTLGQLKLLLLVICYKLQKENKV